MNDGSTLQLLIQGGALVLCGLMVITVGRKLDRLAEIISRVEGRLNRTEDEE